MPNDSPDKTVDKVALVTGGNRGIGLACAETLLASGHKVAITYRSAPPENSELYSVKCDVSNTDEVEAAFDDIEQNLGAPTVLVSNAGMAADGLSLRMSDENFQDILNVNLTGGFRVARRALKNMSRAKAGRIIFISSVVGLGGAAGQANYAASKAGIFGMARSLAKEFASRSITVNVVTPGPISTDMLAALNDKQIEDILSIVPLNRLGSPDEVAHLVNFLASKEAAYITGAIIPVDGGASMGA